MRYSLGLLCAALAFACSVPVGGPSDPVEPTAVEAPTPSALLVPPLAVASPVAEKSAPSLESSLVVHVGERMFMVLDTTPDLAWAEGKPQIVSGADDGFYAVSRTVSEGHVPARARGSMGKRVRLFGAPGSVCEAVVDEVSLLGRVSPDGETYSRWHGEARDEADHPIPAPSKLDMADEAWAMSEGSIVLAAALRPIGHCTAATFAILGDQGRLGALSDVDDGTTSQALAAFRALPEYAVHAASYLAFAKETESTVTAPSWDRHAETNPQVKRVTAGGERLVWVTAGIDGGCGDFGAQLSVLFRERDGGLEVVRVLDGFSMDLEGAIETEEGFELVFPEAHVRTNATDEVERLEIRTLGCQC